MSQSRTLTAIVVSCLMSLTGAVAWAQDEDRDSCVDACKQIKGECIDTCDAHENPIECDEDCQDAEEDCIRQCR